MTIADEARDNAIPCEMVLYAYRKNKDGVVVSFVVHPEDMPDALATARIGSRWVGALVHVGDNELPVQQPAKEKTREADLTPATPRRLDKPAGAKRDKMDWRDVQPAAQAGIRCAEPTFCAFLNETRNYRITGADEAAQAVRDICGVRSRVEFGTDHRKRVLWHQLDEEYLAWKALEHA